MVNDWLASPWIRDRFWSKVEKRGDDECWPWHGRKTRKGYGLFGHAGEVLAHRRAYRYSIGEIPEGLTLDHLCGEPSCVNPAHLEPVTLKENILRGNGVAARNARKTHCLRGHLLDGENLIVRPTGRGCRECSRRSGRESMKRWREKDRLNGFNGQRGVKRKRLDAHYNGGRP